MPLWKINDSIHSNPYFQFASGGSRHPITDMWQLWVTFDGEHVNWVAAYRSAKQIDLAQNTLYVCVEIGEYWNREKAIALLNMLYDKSDAKPLVMPRYIEESILADFVWYGERDQQEHGNYS
ncbi:MAG TPA: hypothetical protein VL461_01155 [Dictyobacter sp.]|jgi:hypothetical protein|nr:hypothetical protein [Dictyobacter sp.]